MKSIYLTILLLGSCGLLVAQNQHCIEPAVLEVHYLHLMQEDTVRKNKLQKDSMILRIGNNMSQFFSYYVFWEDSMMNDPHGRQTAEDMKIKAFETGNHSKLPGRHTTSDYIYKNYPENKITITNQRLIANFIYEEDYVPQKWIITDSTKNILHYPCKLAITNFRGREWYAWFTEDISIGDGPWKLKGLSGLILEAYDKNSDYYYLATTLKEQGMMPIVFYNFHKKEIIPTDRITFLRAKYAYLCGVPSQKIDLIKNVHWGGKKINYLEKNPKRLLYDFPEIDYK